jgi:hypothetical protein
MCLLLATTRRHECLRDRLATVLTDLTDPGTFAKLDLTTRALLNPWRWDAYTLGKRLLSQDVGDAVFRTATSRRSATRRRRATTRSALSPPPNGSSPGRDWAAPGLLGVLDVTSSLQGKLH